MSKNKSIIVRHNEFTPEFIAEAKKLRLWSKIQRNIKTQYPTPKDPMKKPYERHATSPAEVLSCVAELFLWGQTPEGHEWWDDKYAQYIKYS
jgi:hypothetical protein